MAAPNTGGGNIAIWQYDAHVIPRSELELKLNSDLKDAVLSSEEILNILDEITWLNNTHSSEIVSRVDRCMKRIPGWNPPTIYWECGDGGEVQISTTEGKVTEIFFRFDLRTVSDKFVSFTIDFLRNVDGVLAGQDGKILLTEDELRHALSNSAAHAYVANPKKYLESLKDAE